MKTYSIARWTGLLLGATLAVALLLSGRVAEGNAQAPARLSLVAKPAVELGVSPLGQELLSRRKISVGGRAASGAVAVTNLLGAPLEVRARVRSADSALDDVVDVVVLAGHARIYDGKLDGLSSGATLRLGARATRRLRFRVSLPDGATSAGRSIALTLDWRTRKVGS